MAWKIWPLYIQHSFCLEINAFIRLSTLSGILKLNVQQNHWKACQNTDGWTSPQEFLIYLVWEGAWGFACQTHCQGILLLLGPYTENHCVRQHSHHVCFSSDSALEQGLANPANLKDTTKYNKMMPVDWG